MAVVDLRIFFDSVLLRYCVGDLFKSGSSMLHMCSVYSSRENSDAHANAIQIISTRSHRFNISLSSRSSFPPVISSVTFIILLLAISVYPVS